MEQYFVSHTPFPEVKEIMFISSSVVGDDNINCYNVFEIGLELKKKTQEYNFRDFKGPRTQCMRIRPWLNFLIPFFFGSE